MRVFLISTCLFYSLLTLANADEAKITRSPSGWELANGHIQMKISHLSETVHLESLTIAGGKEWAVQGTPLVAFPSRTNDSYRYTDDEISDVAQRGKKLTLRFQSRDDCLISLAFILYPTGAVIQTMMRVENHSQRAVPLDYHVDPLFLHLKKAAIALKAYSSAKGQHGFQIVSSASRNQEFSDWLVLEDEQNNESMLVGGEPGLGVLGWKARLKGLASDTAVRAGTNLIKPGKTNLSPVFELSPGAVVETPISFFALAKGDTDDVGNESFRYLKRYVFLTPLPDSPLVTYCIWLTQKDSEEPLLAEMKFAKRVGFDVFYHDASWYQGSSIVPGMNDWTSGLGSYQEDKEKFPNGIKRFSDSVHAMGMKFGLWVDPGNVDSARVASGEIPQDWLATVDGKSIGTNHPSLTPTKELCLGNPHVVAWIEKQLGDIIERWNLDWVKWDPSSTVTYECTRTDHGHGKTDGAYAAYRGRLEIMRYLLKRFPNLSGFECDPSLQFSRTNPGPQSLLPGGYTNEFVTGPMLSPNVWGSLASVGKGDAGREYLTARWYNASALDYYFRKRFTHGVTFGNINGMASQFLQAAPPGFVEAFQRNLLFFKQYRHLLLEDVYHPKVAATGWSSTQYVKEDASEAVVYIFRDNSKTSDTTIQLRGLDPTAKYRVTSLNDRPGRERELTGKNLMQGISIHLPNDWLAQGDGAITGEFANQLDYGSDILLLSLVR